MYEDFGAKGRRFDSGQGTGAWAWAVDSHRTSILYQGVLWMGREGDGRRGSEGVGV